LREVSSTMYKAIRVRGRQLPWPPRNHCCCGGRCDYMGHVIYLLVLLGCLGVTAPLELALKTKVYARWRKLLLAIAPSVVVFVAWDIYAIHSGQWTFNLDRMTGVILPGGLPVEEALFFLVIPVCAVLTFEGVRRLRPRWAPQTFSAAVREDSR